MAVRIRCREKYPLLTGGSYFWTSFRNSQGTSSRRYVNRWKMVLSISPGQQEKFMLVGAANQCPCGNYGSAEKRCTCLPGAIGRYRQRISGPIVDRIDLHVHVPAVKVEKLTSPGGKSESSAWVRRRVQKARDVQVRRFRKLGITSNAEMSTRMVKEYCALSTDVHAFLQQAVVKMGLSARGYYRVIKVSRSIADLENETHIILSHVAEALQYRPKENPIF